MKTIIRKATIVDPAGPFHKKTMDLLLEDGKITGITEELSVGGASEINIENLHVSTGWFDSSVSFGEPGYEDRETLEGGLATAAASGFTTVALQPNCFPVTDNAPQVNFLRTAALSSAVSLLPVGALTKKSEGRDLAELFDMHLAGAVAFGDYGSSLQNANLLKIALQYVQGFDGLVIAKALDKDIAGHGVAHEGIAAMALGLKGIPALAEEIQLARNLFVLEYTGGRLHIPTISTARSVQLIKEAKSKGLQVSCSVAVHQLVLTEEKLNGFDTRYKVSPPLRSEADRKALIRGVKDGVIDMITSDHNPIDIEHKKMEFDNAMDGTIGLESAFGALMTVLPLDVVIARLTAGYEVFKKAQSLIAEGHAANLTLFNPDKKWKFTSGDILSKSKNSAFLNHPMKGQVHGIINNGQVVLNN
jgi:dihydroorotase